jgi:hypothetical protein
MCKKEIRKHLKMSVFFISLANSLIKFHGAFLLWTELAQTLVLKYSHRKRNQRGFE